MKAASVDGSFDVESEDAMVRSFDSRIRYLARRFRGDWDDLVQAGRIALIESWRAWRSKPQHRAEFWTYARKAVLGGMLDLRMKDSARVMREEAVGNIFSTPACPPDSALELREHLTLLPKREASVVAMHAAGFDASEIASNLGISRARVYQLLGDSVDIVQRRS